MRSNDSYRFASLWAGFPALLLVTLVGSSTPQAGSAPSQPKEPLARVLGVAPGMPEEQAHCILALLGERLKVEEEMEDDGGAGVEREVWRLRDSRYAWMQLAIDTHHRVKAVQVFLRPGGPGSGSPRSGTSRRRAGSASPSWSGWSRGGRALGPARDRPRRRLRVRRDRGDHAGRIAPTTGLLSDRHPRETTGAWVSAFVAPRSALGHTTNRQGRRSRKRHRTWGRSETGFDRARPCLVSDASLHVTGHSVRASA